jgi:hypothetical protein
MKRINKIMLLIIALTSYTTAILSQNLDSLPELKRDSILIAKAKEAVLRYGPEYYREYKTPLIYLFTVPSKGEKNPKGENAGRKMYSVTFPYDTTMELLGEQFAAKVHIWIDTGKLRSVSFGNGLAMIVEGLENDPEKIESIPQIQYQEAIYPIYDWDNPEQKEPKNIDVLRRKGYEEIDGQWVQTKRVPPNINILKREGFEEINGQWVRVKK